MFRFIVFSITTAAIAAQASTPDEFRFLTRTEAIEFARHQNYELRAARHSINYAEAVSLDAGVLPNPEVELSGISDFAFKDEGEYAWSVALAQAFPVTTRLRTERSLAHKEIELARAEIRVAELNLGREVSSLFDQLEGVRSEISALRKQDALNDELYLFLETKVERAEASVLDVRQARLMGKSLELQLSGLERRYASLLDELKRLCGFDPSQELDLAEAKRSLPDALPEYSLGDAHEHPAYALINQLLAIAADQTSIARAERWDDVTLAVFYEEGYGEDEPVGFERERLLGISVSIPIPFNNRNRGSIKGSKVREHQLAAELEATVFELISRAESLRLRYDGIQEQISAYESELIQLSESNLSDIEDAYASGLVGLTEVFRIQEKQLELSVNLLELKGERAAILTEWHYNTAQF